MQNREWQTEAYVIGTMKYEISGNSARNIYSYQTDLRLLFYTSIVVPTGNFW